MEQRRVISTKILGVPTVSFQKSGADQLVKPEQKPHGESSSANLSKIIEKIPTTRREEELKARKANSKIDQQLGEQEKEMAKKLEIEKGSINGNRSISESVMASQASSKKLPRSLLRLKETMDKVTGNSASSSSPTSKALEQRGHQGEQKKEDRIGYHRYQDITEAQSGCARSSKMSESGQSSESKSILENSPIEKERQANRYYKQGEYIKAGELYREVLHENFDSDHQDTVKIRACLHIATIIRADTPRQDHCTKKC